MPSSFGRICGSLRSFTPAGYAIALIAVVAAVVSIQGEMAGWQKALWMLIIAAFLWVEFRAINNDRIENAKTQKSSLRLSGTVLKAWRLRLGKILDQPLRAWPPP
jgi:hypothetical protein